MDESASVLNECKMSRNTMCLQLFRNFLARNSNLYWDSLLFRGGSNFSLHINWKRIVTRLIQRHRHVWRSVAFWSGRGGGAL